MFADDTMTKEIQRSNARTAGSIEIRHVGKIGWGVFALKDYEIGDMVMHPNVIAAIPTGNEAVIDDDDNNKEDKEDVATSANIMTIPPVLTTPTLHTIQMDWTKHVLTNLPTRFMNHKCGTATVGINADSINENGIYNYYALRQIKVGDEITFDYETTEFEMLNGGFECTCVSPICRGQLRGFKYSADAVLKVFDKKHIAPYLHGYINNTFTNSSSEKNN